MDFEVRPFAGGVGAEVIGVDLSGPVAQATAYALRSTWLERGLLVFRGIGTSPEVQLELSRCLGELEPHPIEKFRLGGYPELILLTNEGESTGPVYEFNGVPTTHFLPWHTDIVYTTTPNAGAVLRMVRKSQTGGQTGWVDTAAAYDALDDATKKDIEDVEVVHVFRGGLENMRFNRPDGKRLSPFEDNYPDFPPIASPLAWVHPETGRKALNLSTLNIDHVIGRSRADGDALIQKLLAHTLQPRFQYLHEWENDDMVAWDNRRTMHTVLGHPPDQIRTVHRTTIKGGTAMGRIYEQAARSES